MSALLAGVNHVALVTADIDRLIDFYATVFDAEVIFDLDEGDLRHAAIDLGNSAVLHPFQVDGSEHAHGLPDMFGRGHLDHVALNAADRSAFEEVRSRLVEAGASDGSVVDFGIVRTISFWDPDGGEGEVALWADGDPRHFEDRKVEAYSPPV